MKHDKASYWIVAILIALCALRIVHMAADPPVNLSWSGGLFFDEGGLAHNARNKVLFGEWKLDEWNDFYYNPLLFYIKWAAFAAFGVGIPQERAVSVAFCGLTLWILYLALNVSLPRSTAILGVFLLGFNYIYVMYSRLGLSEIPVLFFAVLTLYFWQLGIHRDRSHSLWRGGADMFFAGISCFSVYVVKMLLIYFLAVPFVALSVLWLFSKRVERKRLTILFVFFVSGFMLAVMLWLVLFYYPNHAFIHQAGDFVTSLSIPRSISHFIKNIAHTPFFSTFFKTPITLIAALLYLLYPAYLMLHKRSKLEPVDLFMGLWFLAHLCFFFGYSYRPTRYYIPIIPPMSVLAARGIAQIAHLKEIRLPGKITFWFWGLCVLFGTLFCTFVFFPLLYRYGRIPYMTIPRLNFQGLLVGGVCLSLVITLLVVWWIRRHYGATIHVPSRFFLGVSVVLMLLFASINGLQYYRWVSKPQYVIRTISREWRTLLEDAFLAGLATPMLCLENTHRALYVWDNFTNYQHTFEKYPITHLFLAEFNNEVGYYRRKFPDVMKRALLLKTYWIKGSKFHLYSVVEPSIENISVARERYRPDEPVTLSLDVKNNDPRKSQKVEAGWLLRPHLESVSVITAKEHVELEALEQKTITISKKVPPGTYDVLPTFFPSQQDVYEAESLSSQAGHKCSDRQASEEQAQCAAGTRGFLVYGPYQAYPAGKYDVGFVLKYHGEKSLTEEPIAVIDVSTDTGQTLLAQQELSTEDFEGMDIYQTFRLSFFLNTSRKLEFRVFTHGHADVWADTITVNSLNGEWYRTPIIVREPQTLE